MKSALKLFTKEEKEIIEKAISDAEEQTSAEIVCAVATESGRFDRAEGIIGLAVALFGLWLVNILVPTISSFTGSWHTAQVQLEWQAAGVTLGFIIGNLLASYVHWLRRLVVGEREITEEVARAVSYVFSERRLASTRDRGGVLVYVSLFEHRVVIMADEGAKNILGDEGIGSLRDLAVGKLRNGDSLGTFVETIGAIADALKTDLPCQDDDENELPNDLRLYHPRP